MNRYEELLEKTTKTIEEQKNISKSLLEVADGIKQNTKELNDKFILHNVETKEIAEHLSQIKDTMMKWVKYLAIALFASVGGATVFRILGADFLKGLIT